MSDDKFYYFSKSSIILYTSKNKKFKESHLKLLVYLN